MKRHYADGARRHAVSLTRGKLRGNRGTEKTGTKADIFPLFPYVSPSLLPLPLPMTPFCQLLTVLRRTFGRLAECLRWLPRLSACAPFHVDACFTRLLCRHSLNVLANSTNNGILKGSVMLLDIFRDIWYNTKMTINFILWGDVIETRFRI